MNPVIIRRMNILLLALFAGTQFPSPLHAATSAESGLRADRLLNHVRVLASEEFEGRAPGTPGEEKTVDYVVRQFKALGLQPGNPDGTYVQSVPLIGITGSPAGSYRVGDKRTDFVLPRDGVFWSRRPVPNVSVTDAEMVFVGYGVVAPEYGWDDFKGVDVRGKVIVMLVGDPPVPDPNDPTKLDDRMFKGRAMTYYGRWTYKFEMAAQRGAAAALIVHETDPAGYPFRVVINSNTGERFGLRSPDQNLGLAAVEGWITMDQAMALLAAAGRDYDVLKRLAVRPDFEPVALGTRASFTVRNSMREVVSRNIVAKLEGSDPRLREEYVVYSAHWDHLGRDPKLSGDQVYHGAYDNATGVAGLIEIAREFVTSQPRPSRSLLFLAPTAEEQGLLGAKFYVEHPPYPLSRTLAVLNMDGLNPWGRTRDVSVPGLGNTTLEDLLKTAAAGQGRILIPDPEPEKGGFFRADHFEFAKVGVPALYFGSGPDYIDKPAGYGKQKRDEFTQNDYHKPTDVIKADWDLSGAIQDLELFIAVGRAVADGDQRPEWKESPVFQVPRQSMPTAVELGLVPAPAELRIGQGEFRVTPRTQVVARDQAIPKARQLIDALAPAMGFRLEFTEGESVAASAIVLALNESLRAELGGEGYTLAVSPQRIDLRAAEPAGLFYAVQTLRQLLSPAVFASKPNRETEWVIPAVSITDIPRFAWRGLLIDPARHFIPVEEVKRFMDIMAWHKFNRLQMHLTDNEGWRIEIKKYPKLTELGSQMDWTSRHRGGAGPRCFGFYTQDDIRALVQYAAERHITLVPEIEMPYHAGSAIVAYPQHGVDPARLAGLPIDQRWAQSNGLLGPRPETVAFMQDVLAEVIALFPSPFIHIGGDEANLQLWTDDPEMQALMRQLGCEDAHQLHSWFVRQMDTFLSARGRRMIGWDEILQGGLAPGATVMSWRGVGGGITAAQAGHDVIMAPTSHTYFDYYQGPPDREPVAIGGLIPLQKVYEFEPIPAELTAAEAKHVLGGQGQLWGEFIATAGHRDYMAWPRACALSEVLWSPAADRNLDRFLQRLDRHRERLTVADVQFRPNDAS